jgi:hypothetical protein
VFWFGFGNVLFVVEFWFMFYYFIGFVAFAVTTSLIDDLEMNFYDDAHDFGVVFFMIYRLPLHLAC